MSILSVSEDSNVFGTCLFNLQDCIWGFCLTLRAVCVGSLCPQGFSFPQIACVVHSICFMPVSMIAQSRKNSVPEFWFGRLWVPSFKRFQFLFFCQSEDEQSWNGLGAQAYPSNQFDLLFQKSSGSYTKHSIFRSTIGININCPRSI